MPLILLWNSSKSVRSTQRFLKTYKWDHDAMLNKYQDLITQSLATEDGMITVDASEFAKKGKNSVGVARQYCGNTGNILPVGLVVMQVSAVISAFLTLYPAAFIILLTSN